MEYIITGLSNQTLSVELRERFAVPQARRGELLSKLLKIEGVAECLLLATCNRTEIHAAAPTRDADGPLRRELCGFLGLPDGAAAGSWYTHANGEAVRHIYRVAAGLDSMVVGEPQVFSQVKEAYREAFTAGATGSVINQVMHRAFFVAKRVRTETGIGLGSTSVSSIAVEIIESSICQRYAPTLIVVGTGETGEAAARTFKDRGLGNLVLINRTRTRAEALAAETGARVAAWDDLAASLPHADAIITACGTGEAILTRGIVEAALARSARGGLLIIDLGVPRDVDPGVAGIEGASLYNIDDLKQAAEKNMARRRGEVDEAERICSEEAGRTSSVLLESRLEPTIASLMRKCEEIRKKELGRALDLMGDMPEGHRRIVDVCTASIVSRIMHDPIVTLKRGTGAEGARHGMIDFFRHIFGLDHQQN